MDESIFDFLRAEPFFTDALNSFNLSAAEHETVMRIRQEGWEDNEASIQKLAKTTSNVGIQYLMIGKWDTILHALGNRNLSPKVIALLLESVRSFGLWTPYDRRFRVFGPTAYSAVASLIKSKVVVTDLNLFMEVWDVFENFEDAGEPTMKARAYSTLLHNALYLNSTKAKSMGMSVNTLLFILSLIHKFPEEAVSTLLTSLRNSIIETRKEEIKSWVEENMSDCVDLPLSWVYEVFDLYAESVSSS